MIKKGELKKASNYLDLQIRRELNDESDLIKIERLLGAYKTRLIASKNLLDMAIESSGNDKEKKAMNSALELEMALEAFNWFKKNIKKLLDNKE